MLHTVDSPMIQTVRRTKLREKWRSGTHNQKHQYTIESLEKPTYQKKHFNFFGYFLSTILPLLPVGAASNFVSIELKDVD